MSAKFKQDFSDLLLPLLTVAIIAISMILATLLFQARKSVSAKAASRSVPQVQYYSR